MFPYASDRKTVRVNEKYPFPAPTPLTMLSPGNENELWISTLSLEGGVGLVKWASNKKHDSIGQSH